MASKVIGASVDEDLLVQVDKVRLKKFGNVDVSFSAIVEAALRDWVKENTK